MKLFFDFDGTLIDSRQRLFQLFQFLIPNSTYSFNEYWSFKRNAISHKEILGENFGYSNKQIQAFDHAWMELIESPEWLALDEPYSDALAVLRRLSDEGHDLYIVTARQFVDPVTNQISKFGWNDIFTDVLVTRQKISKVNLIRQATGGEVAGWIIGDTGNDIETGKQLGLKTAAVLTGFMGKRKLVEYGPDQIVKNLNELRF